VLPVERGRSDRDWFEASVRRDRFGPQGRTSSNSVQVRNVSVFVK
jgi:hypothetical protein